MKCVLRACSFLAGAAVLVWLLLHAGGYQADGSPVDPDPPPLPLMLAGMFAVPLLWSHALGFWGRLCCGHRGGHAGGGGTAEPPAAPDRAGE